jgi:hypothetical protein
MMCSILSQVWLATAFKVSAMVEAELKETVMMLILGVEGVEVVEEVEEVEGVEGCWLMGSRA